MKPAVRLIQGLCFVSAVVPMVSQPSPRWPRADRCLSEPSHGHPFSAEFKLTSVQLLTSGDLSTHVSRESQALDSQGRFYHGGDFPPTVPGAQNLPSLTSGHICDPAGGTQTMWNSRDRRTIILRLPSSEKRHGCWKSEDGLFSLNFEHGQEANPAGDPNITGRPIPGSEGERSKALTQDMGITMIQGLEARGYGSSWPPPEQGQNEPPYLNEEHWIVPSLNLWVSQEVEYPRKINRTIRWSRELVSIKDSEPEAALFQPPPDYPVTDEEIHSVSCKDLNPPQPPQSSHLK